MIVTLVFIFIIGLAIGSFSNVLIDRLPHDETLMGRSHCDHCRRLLDGLDLIPVLSYVFLRGRCRTCHHRLSIQYPLVELWTGVLFVLGWMYTPLLHQSAASSMILFNLDSGMMSGLVADTVARVGFVAVLACLNVIFFADLKYQIIPDVMQIALLVSSVVFLLGQGILPHDLGSRLVAAVAVMIPLLLIYVLTKGKGMGFGDVKLALIIGFLLGMKAGFLALYAGFLVGAVVGVYLIIAGRKAMKSKIAFGPFLIVGIVMMLAYGPFFLGLLHRYYGW